MSSPEDRKTEVPPINPGNIARALRWKYFSDSLLLFLGCAVGVFGFCWFRIWIVGNLDTKKFRQIIDLLPDDWRQMASVDFDWLVSYIGRTALTLEEPTLISFICLWVLVRGSDVVSGELNRGTMELIAAQPVSRRRLYFTHARMTCFGLLLLTGLCWFGMSMGIWTTTVEESTYPSIHVPLMDYDIPLTFLEPKTEIVTMSSEVSPMMFLPGVICLFCLGFMFAGVASLFSAMDRYRWRTLGILAVIYFGCGLLKMLSMAKEEYRWLAFFNFFGYYEPGGAILLCEDDYSMFFTHSRIGTKGALHLGPAFNCLILLTGGSLCYWWGYVIFQKRDLPAPL